MMPGDGFRFYTMANDRMATSFVRFLRYFSVFGRGSTLYVIPFDDNLTQIEASVSNRDDVVIVRPDNLIDEIGKEIFGEEEYRPGIECWRYLRKLNAFIGHNEPFVFADANTVLLADMRNLLSPKRPDGKSIFFGGHSAPNRSIRLQQARDFLDVLNSGLGSAYNCGFIYSRGGSVDLHVARSIAQRTLRKIIGRSPEQGFLAYYIAVCGLAHATISELIPGVANTTSRTPLVDLDDGYLRVASPPYSGCIKYGLKFTGQDLVAEPEQVTQFLARTIANQDRDASSVVRSGA